MAAAPTACPGRRGSRCRQAAYLALDVPPSLEFHDSAHRVEMILLLRPSECLHHANQIARRGDPRSEATTEVDPLGPPTEVSVALGPLGYLPGLDVSQPVPVAPNVPFSLSARRGPHAEREDGLIGREAGALRDHEVEVFGDLVGALQDAGE